MTYNPTVKPALLKGVVQASMKKKNYQVEISIDSEDGIIQALWSCPRGAVICHHMASLCIYAHYNISSTDSKCTWNVPKVQKLKDLFPSKKRNYQAVSQNANDSEIAEFVKRLDGHVIGFSWLLRPEPTDCFLAIIPSVEDILSSADYLASTKKIEYLSMKLAVTNDIILQVAKATTSQSANEHRVTASKFGPILSACSRQRFPPSLFKNLLKGYDIGKLRAVQCFQK